MEPVLMIRPQPPAIMYGKAALLAWKAEFRQTAMTSSHFSSNKDDGKGEGGDSIIRNVEVYLML
jgi:hypothetical protein